jgi:hypothetical protein
VAPELLIQQQHAQHQELQLQRLSVTDSHKENTDRAECGDNSSCSAHADCRSANRSYNASGKVPVIVFVGEFLQILSKCRFRAAVHRVRDVGVTHKMDEERGGRRVTGRNSTDSANDSGYKARSQGAEASSASQDCSALVNSRECIYSQQRRPVRISCPYLIRGRHDAILDIHNTARYTHPGGAAAIAEENMPDLDGTSVKLMYSTSCWT